MKTKKQIIVWGGDYEIILAESVPDAEKERTDWRERLLMSLHWLLSEVVIQYAVEKLLQLIVEQMYKDGHNVQLWQLEYYYKTAVQKLSKTSY